MLPDILERLAPPLPQLGLPMGGRRAITFSDSRQGVARLAAKLQQDAERTLTRAFLYHAIQEGQGPSGEERARLEKMLKAPPDRSGRICRGNCQYRTAAFRKSQAEFPGVTSSFVLARNRNSEPSRLRSGPSAIGVAVIWPIIRRNLRRCSSIANCSVARVLFDTAAGGAGLVARLAKFDWFKACLLRAVNWLDCRESCDHGCPACILRPDLNFGEEFPDRPGAHVLAQDMCRRLDLAVELQVLARQ